MRDDQDSGGPLWADGDMMFRVCGAGAEPDRLVKVRRPFALLGRAPDADVALDDRAVSARHAYLHLDPRGVFAVDLVTRAGTRINGTSRTVGWLRPGDWLEVAGRRVELLRMRLNGAVVEPPPCDADLLAHTRRDTLAAVTLEPQRPDDPPWELGSELVFVGWSASCGIQVKDPSLGRTHCALVRTTTAAYLVDLLGRQTWVEDRPVRGASALRDGDRITLGTTQFTVRMDPPARPAAAHLPAVLGRHHAPVAPARLSRPPAGLPLRPELIPPEAQTALLAWVVGNVQEGQGELIRQQGEFQLAVTEALRQIQRDSATLLNAQLQRIESIDRELAALRAEIQRRHAPPAPPHVPPLRIARPPQSPPAAEPGSPESQASTTWLLHRVSQLEDENRSAWKDLLGRLSQPKKAT